MQNPWKQMDGYGSPNELTNKWKHVCNHAGFYLQVQGGIAVNTSMEKQKQNDVSERASSKVEPRQWEQDSDMSKFTNHEDSVTHHAREGERFTSNNQGLRLASMRTSKPYSSARGNREQRMHISGERET